MRRNNRNLYGQTFRAAWVDASVRRIEKMTSEAYSRGYFTDSGWRMAMRQLLKRGWKDDQIIQLLRSKHIRWAIDSAPKQKSRYTSVDIMRYLDTPKRFVPALYKVADFNMLFDFSL